LKADDLRFSLNEGVEFLKQYAPGNPLAINDMQVLIKRTEGWVAGLVLAASIVSRGDQRSHVLEIFTGAHVFLREFFMESVLHQQPEEVKNFLLRTSILEQLTGPLCNAVTGRVDGEQILARLWEDSSFMERIEESGRYRYHEMFAEMLRAQLNEQFPAEITRLHRKAAKWYRTHTFPAEAISHYLLGRSWEEAAVLIEAVALNELERFGEDSRLLRWIQQLPDEVVVQHRTLLLLYIRLARLVLPSSETEELINRTEHNVAVLLATQKTGALQETYNAIRNVRHLWTTNTPTVFGLHLSKEYDAVGQMLDDILQFQRNSRIHLITAEAKASEVYKNAVSKGHLYSILIAGGEYANLAFSQGFLRRSEQIAQQVLKQANEFRGQLPQPASIALTALSGVYFERNQLAQSYDLLKRAIEIAPDSIRANESIKIAIMRAKIQSMEEEPDAAIDTIETIRALSSQHPSSIWFDQDLAAYQALFRLHQGDFLSAERHLGGGWEIDQQPFSAFIRASILVQQNRNLAAEEILRYLLNRYPHSFYWVPILRARVLLSIALFKQQKIKEACQVMVEAARIAAPEYFVRPFLSADPQIAAMLSLVLHTENLAPGTKSFIKGTLAMVGHVDGLQTVSGRDEQISYALSASISPREQEILQSLGMGLSNQEIADKFSISSSTVKTHLENIFRKLGVSKRTQAIAKAHALGLIEIMAKKF
ncbi:MAG TPA: LuxR C-terminal-related transcriptional regulator, partial [Anaerolineaceae bacterium]|nr:LuxR C-terminal-related transcriptional regulator [Anaerolineaceae bacterium]